MKLMLRIGCTTALLTLLTAILLRDDPGVPPATRASLRSPSPPSVGAMEKPPAVVRISSDTPLLPPAVTAQAHSQKPPPAPLSAWMPENLAGRSAEESIMSYWAARDPQAAGHWLNQNRDHPKFADYVRGYAIQIAVIDPDAARQWAARLNGNGNRFARGGTLEQHIDAVEEMFKTSAAPPADPRGFPDPPDPKLPFLADYTPVLVRQHPGEEPVLEMQPLSPFG